MRQKVIFIIPGYRQKITSKAYVRLSEMFTVEGYTPILVDIPWKNTTISENTAYFLKVYRSVKSQEKYILGFSYGAMIAFIAATKISVYGLILCSLSPYFNEDISKKRTAAQTTLMRMRYKDFLTFHAESLSKMIKAKRIVMLYGKQESRVLIKRVRLTFNQISSTNKHLISISKTEHEIGNKKYLDKIHEISRDLI